jgi:hypothetical protein
MVSLGYGKYYLQKIFEIDHEIFKIGKIFEMYREY